MLLSVVATAADMGWFGACWRNLHRGPLNRRIICTCVRIAFMAEFHMNSILLPEDELVFAVNLRDE